MIDTLKHYQTDIETLCRAYGVARLELFGSAARSDFDHTRSDLDFLVEFAPDADLGPWMSRFFELREKLTVLLGRDVDLVFAKGLRNPYLIKSINNDRHLMYAAENTKAP